MTMTHVELVLQLDILCQQQEKTRCTNFDRPMNKESCHMHQMSSNLCPLDKNIFVVYLLNVLVKFHFPLCK